ncbi:MAG: hypothetical protein DMG35_19785 [Acidobacteria bacterium]|nr:MAG: hypothetical protein DMG35_19785 [Acidobacteriota bacterium]
MTPTPSEYYTKSFYDEIRAGSLHSAEIILPLVLKLLPVRSLVDVGCCDGSWLSVARKLGVNDVLGMDGDHIDPASLQIPQDCFQPMDLTKPFTLNRAFDLAISLEVAEHLPADSAAGFVESLTRLAPVILFSAAIPLQGGNHHLNEQWPETWAQLFREHDFLLVDCIRKQVWLNEAVEYWYAQNALLFVQADVLEASALLKAEFEQSNPAQLRLVHPRKYLELQSLYREAVFRAENPPPPSGVIAASRLLAVCLKNAVRKRLFGDP